MASCELDGELEEFDAARVRRHLSECRTCAAWFVDVRRCSEFLGGTESELPQETIVVPVLRRRLARASTLAGAGASAAAAALAAVVVGLPAIGGSPASNAPGGDGNPAAAQATVVDRSFLLTAFRQTYVVDRPGVQNPALEIE